MKRNEKVLASALLVVLIGYVGWKVVVPRFVGPIEELQSKADDLQATLSDQQAQQLAAVRADRRLDDARKRSLPGSGLDAQRLYQQWLAELALAAGLNVSTTPNRIQSAGDVYNSVQVTLEGTATFDELETFLRRFRQADLLHRVFRLDVGSPAVEGDPELRIALTAEGLNVKGAATRNQLFPQLELAEPLPVDTATLAVSAREFKARPGDMIRIENEYATVAEVAENSLTLKRGSDGTDAAAHPAGTRVELLPVRTPEDGEPAIVVAEIESPFVKPRVYDPRFDGFADTTVVRGNAATMTVTVTDFDRDAGDPKLELVSGPTGLSLDAATGAIAWSPASDVESGEYKVTLAADVPEPRKRLEKTVTITLADPNTPPTVAVVDAREIFLGESLTVPIYADDAESDGVDLRLENGPAGATLDGGSREFRWTVPESFSPGDVDITVVAADRSEPPMESRQTFKVTVRENLKPFVRLSGTLLETAEGGTDASSLQKEAFLYDRSQNEWMRLREGRSFTAAGLTALVKEIGIDFITYVRNGEIWKVRVGDDLGKAEKIGDEPVAAARPDRRRPPVESPRPSDVAPNVQPSTAAADPTPPM